MEEGKVFENHLTSAAAFVEGGIQDACDDACSICLEAFCDSDPSTLTCWKHEFHLQCILVWCQRSSQCPLCWQPISLKDPSIQELLDAVEHERNMRMKPPRNTTIFHHPTWGDFELQHPRGQRKHSLILSSLTDLHSIGGLVPFLGYLKYSHANIRAKAAEVVSTIVQNNPRSQQLVMEANGLEMF